MRQQRLLLKLRKVQVLLGQLESKTLCLNENVNKKCIYPVRFS